MKRSHVAALIVFVLLIPATLYLGSQLSGRSYYITGTLIILEMLIPFFMAFEGRKPQARELVLVAVMCALAIVGRIAIPIPHFKAAFAIIMLAGMVFGPETGFMVGAITALVSNFFYGQGPYTPWQMMSYGAGGMLAGFLFARGRLPRTDWVMALVGFFTVVLWVGPLMDCASIFLLITEINVTSVMGVFLSGLYVNLLQAASTAVVLMFFGKPILKKLERVQMKYGMIE